MPTHVHSNMQGRPTQFEKKISKANQYGIKTIKKKSMKIVKNLSAAIQKLIKVKEHLEQLKKTARNMCNFIETLRKTKEGGKINSSNVNKSMSLIYFKIVINLRQGNSYRIYRFAKYEFVTLLLSSWRLPFNAILIKAST